MPRTALTIQVPTIAGIAPSYVAGDNVNGMTFVNDGNTYLQVKNTGGSPCTVTFTTPYTVGGVALADPTVSVPATTGDRVIGPFDTAAFNQADGTVYADFSTGTGVTVGAFKIN